MTMRKRKSNKPVALYWLPFDNQIGVISLGLVSSSFLMTKRLCRHSEGGCLVASDVNAQSPTFRQSLRNPEVTLNPAQGCKMSVRNGRVAKAACELFERDQDMKRRSVALPSRIECGSLLTTIRTAFLDLTPVQELSLKTSKKLVKPCGSCLTKEDSEEMIENYKRERFLPLPPVDVAHLSRFKLAVRQQVRTGWNLRKGPYFPTGNATRLYSRREGGSWRSEEFSRSCRVSCVPTAGKLRIVTLYSGRNSEILKPLHDSLYASLAREGWLLVGSPTDELVSRLNGTGPYVSVDYKNATDNIRAEYCRAVIEILKEKALDLSDEERLALDVVGELRFTDDGPAALRGQPMGSLMSFPMLCLINKACVDLALLDQVHEGKLDWKQFRSHRCLINGDDLLYREFDNSCGILASIRSHGSSVGLVVNTEKTMVSSIHGEINSCVFQNGRKQKKTNASVVEWRCEVSDPIGFLADSVCKPSVFASCLDNWRKPIRRAWPKIQGPVPPSFLRRLWRVRRELTSRPTLPPPKKKNPFDVVTKPAGYDLSREEEGLLIAQRIDRLRELISESVLRCGSICMERFPYVRWGRKTLPEILREDTVAIQTVLKKQIPIVEDTVLKVLADGWQSLTKEKLCQNDCESFVGIPDPQFARSGWVNDDGSLAPIGFRIIQELKQFKKGRCATADAGFVSPGAGDSASSRDNTSDLADEGDFIRF